MSTTDGPMVPLRTFSCALRSVARSTSSNFFSVMRFFFPGGTAGIRHGVGRGTTFEKYSVQPLKSSYRTVESTGILGCTQGKYAQAFAQKEKSVDYFQEIAGVRLAFWIQSVQQLEAFLLKLFIRYVLDVIR